MSTEFVKPFNCMLGFGIPTNKEEFDLAKTDSKRDFVIPHNWSKYKFDVVSPIERALPILDQFKFKIIDKGVTLKTFKSMFDVDEVKVVIFVSHRNDKGQVEFFDGLAETEAIVNQIPEDFNGIIDMTTCLPRSLAIEIREKRPNCLVRFADKKITYPVWMAFFQVVGKILNAKDISYLEACELAMDLLIGE
jgi:hypothetical protein